LGTALSERDMWIQKHKELSAKVKDFDSKYSLTEKTLLNQKKLFEGLSSEYVKIFVKSVFLSVQVRVETVELQQQLTKNLQISEDLGRLQVSAADLQKRVDGYEQRIADVHVQFQSKLKVKDKQIKELQVMLEVKEHEESNKSKQDISAINMSMNSDNSVSPREFNNNNGTHSPKPSMGNMKSPMVAASNSGDKVSGGISGSNLKRKSSIGGGSSNGSADNTSKMSNLDVDTNEIMKENNILLGRVGELQTSRWKLEEKLAFLSDNVNQLRDELDKKKAIIHYYMQREKLGRLTPEQESNKAKMNLKGNTFVSQILSGKVDPKILAESYVKMQQVMEETILQNIASQNNIKLLGEDVARLMDEIKKLKSGTNKSNTELSLSSEKVSSDPKHKQ